MRLGGPKGLVAATQSQARRLTLSHRSCPLLLEPAAKALDAHEREAQEAQRQTTVGNS